MTELNDPRWIKPDDVYELMYAQSQLKIAKLECVQNILIISVLCERLENAISAMVDLGASASLCELVEARGAIEWLRNIVQMDVKIAETLAAMAEGDE